MSTRRSYLKGSTYAADDEATDYNDSSRRPYLRFTGTSSKMDVSPETGAENLQPIGKDRRKFCCPESVSTPKGRRPYLSHTVEYDRGCEHSVTGGEKNTSRRPFLHENLSCMDERSFSAAAVQPIDMDPIEEALTALENLKNQEPSSTEVAELLEKTAGQLYSKSKSSKKKAAKQNTPSDQPAKTAGTTKSSSKGKESLSVAALKDKILEKVPMIKYNNGLYAYNGRTYVAINDANQIVGIVINQVDDTMFGLSTTNIFTSVLTALQVDEKLVPADYTERAIASEHIVAFKNTLLDVRTLKKIPFNPWHITSFEIDANYVTHPEPETYLDFLHTASGGDSDIEARITDSISYILSGSNRGKLFMVYGPAPDSGKSSLATILQELIGDKYTFNVSPNEFKDRFSLGGSRGRILNVSMDLPSTVLHSDVVATIKKITGGDKLMSQDKNEKKEFGVSSMRLLFGTNNPISVHPSDDNDSFWDRLQIVPFIHSVASDEKDPHLVQKMLAERDDLVSYCIQKMPEIIERGYKLSPCQAAEDIKNEWRYGVPEAESLESFCDTFIEITGDTDNVVLATDVYTPYRAFCADIGVQPLREEQIKKWFNDHGAMCKRKRFPGDKNAKSSIFGIRFLE